MHLHQVETVLKGVVRAERLETPSDFIPAILARVRKEYVQRQYLIREWDDANTNNTVDAFQWFLCTKERERERYNFMVQILGSWTEV